MKSEKNFINFKTKADELIRYQCRSSDNSSLAEKELFCFDGCYFFYAFNRTDKVRTFSLREVTKEEYGARKEELMLTRPYKGCSAWHNNINTYLLHVFHNGTWNKNIPAADCIFITDNPLKDVHEAVLNETSSRMAQAAAYDQALKQEYAKKCGGLSRKLGIPYVNVMRIGPEKGKLMKFKESYAKAVEKANAMPLREKRKLYYNLFQGGRITRKEAMDFLNIQYFDADVSHMELNELKQTLSKHLDAYTEASVKEAIKNGIEMDYHDRKRILDILMRNCTRSQKKEILTELNVDTYAIDINSYSFAKIKRALAATVGEQLEQN